MRGSCGCLVPSRQLLRFLKAQLDGQCPLPSPLSHRPAAAVTGSIPPATSAYSQPTLSSRQCRSFTSTPDLQDSFWRRYRPSRQPPKQPLKANDLPRLGGFLDDASAGLGGRIIKPADKLMLRCTEFDEDGNVTLVNGEFKKTELIQKYSLLSRDLRKIDSSVLPSIVVRKNAILVNLLHIRCLIKWDRVLVFDVYGSTNSYAQSLFMYDLEGKLRQKLGTATGSALKSEILPYEFRALEAVLISVTQALESEFDGVHEPVVHVLRELEEDISRDKLRHLLIYSKKLGTFEQKARLVRDAIEDLLEADDDLASMYLTEKAQGKQRQEENHEEVELLLESYHKVADEIVQVSSNLVSSIRNTEEIVKAILDANRNSLMMLELKFSIGTLGLGIGTFVAALYGMNLKNFIEESDYGFWGVSGTCAILTVISVIYGLRKLRKIQRLSMWGEGGSVGTNKGRNARGSWREIDSRTDMRGAGAGSNLSGAERYQRLMSAGLTPGQVGTGSENMAGVAASHRGPSRRGSGGRAVRVVSDSDGLSGPSTSS
ncbi:cora-domain-containing protein [Polychaeton citri CBS 116435]|uniref:Magnesium transporter n=1 Tax=Polychaeton citri CBS 116435 TaxID=1314669 RepID=A0A9P4UNE1_9PEZI|nr:cora-domain-containing protein [Polychaeton citri CBS 116435]